MSVHDMIAELMKQLFILPANKHADIFYKIGKLAESEEYIDQKKYQHMEYKKTKKIAKKIIKNKSDDDVLQFDLEL